MTRNFAPPLAALAAFLLVACVSTPATAPVARPVPAERQYAYQEPVDGGITLVIYREPSNYDTECLLTINVETHQTAMLIEGEMVELHLPAGKIKLSFGRTGATESCRKDKQFGSNLGGTFAPGEVQRLRVQITSSTVDAQPLDVAPVIAGAGTPEPATPAVAPAAAPPEPAVAPAPLPAPATAEPVAASAGSGAEAAVPAEDSPLSAAPAQPDPALPTLPGYKCVQLQTPEKGFTCTPLVPVER